MMLKCEICGGVVDYDCDCDDIYNNTKRLKGRIVKGFSAGGWYAEDYDDDDNYYAVLPPLPCPSCGSAIPIDALICITCSKKEKGK